MSTPMMMTNCPSEETLAAFIDGRLDPESRRRVVEHMSSCADCYSVISAAWDLQAADPAVLPAPAPVVRGRFGWGRVWVPAAAALGAAAMVSFVFLYAPLHDRLFPPKTGIEALIRASEGINNRNTEARLSGGFPYRSLRRMRGGPAKTNDGDSYQLQAVASQVQTRALRNPTPENLHALGVAQLLLGDWDPAVGSLESAIRGATHQDDLVLAINASTDVTLVNDLAAGLWSRALQLERPDDYMIAAQAAERAWTLKKDAETAWNRALTTESLHVTNAVNAWNDYLAIDASSPWAAEVRRRINTLRGQVLNRKSDNFQKFLDAALPFSMSKELSERVQQEPQQARLFAQEELIPAWATTGDARSLSLARLIGDELLRTHHDPIIATTVQTIREAEDESAAGQPGRLLLLRSGHSQYLEARRLYQIQDAVAAERLFRNAEMSLRQAESPFSDQATIFIAGCQYYQNEYRRCIETVTDLEATGKASPIVVGQAQWLRGLSLAVLGRRRESTSAFHQAAASFNSVNEKEHVAAVSSLIAENLEYLGDGTLAAAFRWRALELSHGMNDATRRHTLFNEAAEAALRRRCLRAALLFQTEVVDAARESRSSTLLAYGYLWRALVKQEMNDGHGAAADMHRSRTAGRNVNDAAVRAKITAEQAFYEAIWVRPIGTQRGIDLLSDAAAFFIATHDHVRLGQLFYQRGMHRRAFGDLPAAEADLRQSLHEFERQRDDAADLAVRLSYVADQKQVLTAVVDLLLQTSRPAEAFKVVDASRTRSLDIAGDFAGEAGYLTTGDPALPPVAVSYLVEPTRLIAWVITAHGIHLRQISCSESELRSRISEFRELIVDDGVDGSRTAIVAERLSNILISPVADLLPPGGLLVVIPDSLFGDLPFGALRNSSSQGFLIQERPVAIAPSLQFYLRAARTSVRAPMTATAVISSRAYKDGRAVLSALPSAAIEISALKKTFSNVIVLTGDHATREAVLRAISNSDILLYSGHARLHPTEPRASALVLSRTRRDDGLLDVSEITKRHGKARLIVLSACDTAAADARGIGLSFATAFLSGGANAVVAALLPIDDESGSILISAFYASLARGSDGAHALRDAQIDAIRRQDHRVWAAFQIFGAYAAPIKGELRS